MSTCTCGRDFNANLFLSHIHRKLPLWFAGHSSFCSFPPMKNALSFAIDQTTIVSIKPHDTSGLLLAVRFFPDCTVKSCQFVRLMHFAPGKSASMYPTPERCKWTKMDVVGLSCLTFLTSILLLSLPRSTVGQTFNEIIVPSDVAVRSTPIFFGLWQRIAFSNEPCFTRVENRTTLENPFGVCYFASECSSRNGVATAACAGGTSPERNSIISYLYNGVGVKNILKRVGLCIVDLYHVFHSSLHSRGNGQGKVRAYEYNGAKGNH